MKWILLPQFHYQSEFEESLYLSIMIIQDIITYNSTILGPREFIT